MVPFVVEGGCAAVFVMDVSPPKEGVIGGGRTGRLLRGDDEVVAANEGRRSFGTAVVATVGEISEGKGRASGTKGGATSVRGCKDEEASVLVSIDDLSFPDDSGADGAKLSLLTISGDAGEGTTE